MADEPQYVGMPESRSYVPIPDPTLLTTEALKRENTASRELIELRVVGVRDTLDAKIAGVSSNIALIEDRMNKLVDRATHEVRRLQELHAEKFAAVQNQFEARDIATSAAILAQKEAVNAQNIAYATATTKAEISFTKQIDSLADKINDIKSRVDQGAGKEKGSSDTTSLIMGIAAIIISFGTLFFLVFHNNQSAPAFPVTVQNK